MYTKKKILAIIPARGGSKRLPKKNIKQLAGKPLIEYSIKQALKSKYIDDVYVSSDNQTILEKSKQIGAKVIKRPKEYATDNSITLDVIKHALKVIKGKKERIIVLLQPTSPLRKTKSIDKAIEKIIDKNADTVISVNKRHLGPEWIFKKDGEQINFLIKNDLSKTRSQEQEETYEINGAIYAFSEKVIDNAKKYPIGSRIYPLILNKVESWDIDTLEDFKIAELFMKQGF